ncbi:amidase family protein [Achromobacter agilis]|uniref:Glutamyl-tRNA(Gln) amidotransferase subunit A n=1 Tax=Achromobacter agilis TaxID=1353888 RepID=A0A446CEZ9_9BURK|nr:amidase family protein [Achromobacter agilis]SSW66460.1 Glutamyl-tRNA(Gln) amidotransferase subunit A [Achromobacter agilis]
MSPDQSDVSLRAVSACLAQMSADPDAAARALLLRRDEVALAEAQARDALRALAPGGEPLAGMVLGVKACFDVQGWITHAGSRVLSDASAAAEDAPLVRRLRRAGAVLLAQNNMTEFAYGALGLNATFGTPLTPCLADMPRVAGGSSSGGAVAVAQGMVNLAVVSDTSGSARIPAAFCGVAGFKPSRGRYPDAGMMYLSPSFDVPGIIAADAAQCLRVDKALASREALFPAPAVRGTGPLASRNFVVPDHVEDLLDPEVRRAFSAWLERLMAAGAVLRRLPMPCVAQAGPVARDGGIIAAEAYMLHAPRLATDAARYDPRVGPRMLLGAQVPAHAYLAAQRRLAELRREYDAAMASAGADAVLTPTVPMLPPTLAQLEDNEAYLSENSRAFSLTEFANRLDLPSISLPGDLADRRAVGLMATGLRGGDRALLATAVQIEAALGSAARRRN